MRDPQQVQQAVATLLARMGRPDITVGSWWSIDGLRVKLYRGKASVPVGVSGAAGALVLSTAVARYAQGDPGPLRRLLEDAVRELEAAGKSGGGQEA